MGWNSGEDEGEGQGEGQGESEARLARQRSARYISRHSRVLLSGIQGFLFSIEHHLIPD